MPREAIVVSSIKDWIPLLDKKQIPAVRVLGGKNFMITERGVKSPFGSAQITAAGYSFEIETSKFTFQSFQAGGSSFIFTDRAVVRYEISTRIYEVVFTFAHNISEYYAWTHAYIGVHDYFAHKSIGCIRYSSGENKWEFVSAEIMSVAAARGRLVGVTKTAFLWSAIDNGVDFVPSQTTGAGAQALSILGVEGELDVLGVESTFDGVYTFTTQGVLYSRYQENEFIFNHIPLTVKTYPLNSRSIVNEEGIGLIFAAETGFYKLDKGIFTAWQPAMSLYFRENIIPNMFEREQLVMFWDRAKQRLYFSYEADKGSVYQKAFVLDLAVEQWGHFDKPHLGFITIDGKVSYLQTGQIFQLNDSDTDTKLAPEAEWQSVNLVAVNGEVTAEVASVSLPAIRSALIWDVTVGGLKLLSESAYDRLTILSSVTIDREKWAGSVPNTTEDLGNVASGMLTDLNNQAEALITDFYLLNYATLPVPKLRIFGSETLDNGNDGVVEIAELGLRTNTREVYSCYSSGLYQALEFKTGALGSKLNINLISLGAFLGGRIY